MRTKILPLCVLSLLMQGVAVSCLDDNEYTYSDEANIMSFSIGDIETVIVNGDDTTTFVVEGEDVSFTIDQIGRRIYNNDSLPYQTDVRKVTTSINSTAQYITYILPDRNGEDSVCLWSSSDSLNMASPLSLTVYAPSGLYSRIYEVRLNVHQVDPDSLTWQKMEGTGYPGMQISGKQKAVCWEGRVFVFADKEPQVEVTSTEDGRTWTALVSLNGLDAKADYSSVLAFQGRLWLIAGNEVYSSSNGVDWRKEPVHATGLVAAFSHKLIAVDNGEFIEGVLSDGTDLQWNRSGSLVPEHFPDGGYAFALSPLKTNYAIEQLILLGKEDDGAVDADSTAIWASYSDDNRWIRYETESNHCPNLSDMGMISYDDALYVFGGKGRLDGEEQEAFQYFYESRDDGLTWKPVEEHFMFPRELVGMAQSFSYVVDSEHYIWIMPSGNAAFWKGRLNRLGFDKTKE